MKILISGGAGFIGSTVASACLDAGLTPVLLDDLSTGRREFTAGRIFYQGDICDSGLVDRICAEHPGLFAAVHCAAKIVVPASVADPAGYYRANVAKSLDFVTSLMRNGCRRLLFSSSAAIYAPGTDLSVTEDSPVSPQSPYARTKAMCEQVFADIARSGQMSCVSLRYFNPIGADPAMRTGLQLRLPSHALGQLITAQAQGRAFRITGTDYPTRDGSGIRDYIHVWDLAAAHVAALAGFDRLVAGTGTTVLNLGTGQGTTVRELVAAFNRVAASPVTVTEGPRRPGDVAGAYSRSGRARELLGWVPRYGIGEGIAHSLQWAAIRDNVIAAPEPSLA